MKYIECPDLSENRQVDFFTAISNKVFHFVMKWNEYCDCCILDIYDSQANEIRTGLALQCNTKIITDKREMPPLFFAHKDGLTTEPTPETFKDYRIYYEDTAE